MIFTARLKSMLTNSLGRVRFIVTYFVFHAMLFGIDRVIFTLKSEYSFNSIFVLSFISILITCILCYKRLLNINPKYKFFAAVPLLSFVFDLRWMALLNIGGATLYNYSVAPILALSHILFLLVLAVVPGRVTTVST